MSANNHCVCVSIIETQPANAKAGMQPTQYLLNINNVASQLSAS